MFNYEITLFMNCRVVRDGELKKEHLWIQGGRVIEPRLLREATSIYDCTNHIICAGYLDLQINGAFGVDFLLEPDKEKGLAHVRKQLLATGCTGMCPTLITAKPEDYKSGFRAYARTPATATEGAGVLGIHCEGPFISKKKKGAHPEELIQDFDNGWDTVVETYGENISDLKIVTLACEKDNSVDVIRELVSRGIRVSLGHTMATLDDCNRAVAAGANLITHLFNAMPAFHHRDPSVPGLVTRAPQNVYYGIIADGIHTHPTAVRLAYRMHPKGMCLVTDAIGPMGEGEGEFALGSVPLVIMRPTPEDHPRAYVRGTTTLCGAIQPIDACVRFAYQTLGIEVAKVLELASIHPAQCLGVDEHLGHLKTNAIANMIILDDDLNVRKTFCQGVEAWSADDAKDILQLVNRVV